MTSETGQNIQNWILYHGIIKYIDFVFRWDPMKLGGHIHLQKYVEFNGSIAYLKYTTVKQIVGLKKYMCMLSDQDRPGAQKNNHLYHISGHQLFKLTACNVKTALVNEKLETQKSCHNSCISYAPLHIPFIFWTYEVHYPLGAYPIQERSQTR